ncbi:transcription factor RFX4-like [Periplaneta americana]|uniref:transcription factor RFX4-like n=1 Tax=Periplaneta americana TaxID=6978 RepID=UPI0037E7381C
MQGKRGSNNQVSSGSSTNHVPTKATPSTTTIPVLEFPNMQDVPLPSGVPHQLFHSFFTMYRAHCLRIFNSICRNELDEVQEFLQHFWKGVPLHLMGILGSNAVVNMVGVCDSILYRSIAGIFVPSTRKTSPVLLAMLKKLVPLIDGWFYTMLATLPANLCTVKRNLAHHFCRVLRRLISLHQIWLSVALLLQNSDSIARMLVDWRGTNVEQICSEVAFGMKWPETKHVMLSLFKEFEYLLENQVGLDILVQWFETVVDRCVTSAARERGCPVRRIARHFLLIWVTVGARVLRDLTLTSTHSFGSFHMLSLLANDYLAHCVELLEAEERTSEMMRNISLCSDTISPVSGKQSVPSATITTSQEILEYHEEAMLTSMPFPYQPNFSGSTRSSYDYICLTSPRQPNFSTKDIGHSSLMQEDSTEDCRYSQAKRYDFVDVASTPMICPTPCAYQGYQQYTLNTDCHSGRSTSLPPA